MVDEVSIAATCSKTGVCDCVAMAQRPTRWSAERISEQPFAICPCWKLLELVRMVRSSPLWHYAAVGAAVVKGVEGAVVLLGSAGMARECPRPAAVLKS